MKCGELAGSVVVKESSANNILNPKVSPPLQTRQPIPELSPDNSSILSPASSSTIQRRIAENIDSNRFLAPFLRKQAAMHPSKLRAPMGKVTDSMLTATEEAARWKRRRKQRQKKFEEYLAQEKGIREEHTVEGRKVIQDDVLLRLGDIFGEQVVKIQCLIRRKIIALKRVERRKAVLAALPTVPIPPLSAIGSTVEDIFPHYIENHLKECEASATAIQSHFRGMHTRNGRNDSALRVETVRPKTSIGENKVILEYKDEYPQAGGNQVDVLNLEDDEEDRLMAEQEAIAEAAHIRAEEDELAAKAEEEEAEKNRLEAERAAAEAEAKRIRSEAEAAAAAAAAAKAEAEAEKVLLEAEREAVEAEAERICIEEITRLQAERDAAEAISIQAEKEAVAIVELIMKRAMEVAHSGAEANTDAGSLDIKINPLEMDFILRYTAVGESCDEGNSTRVASVDEVATSSVTGSEIPIANSVSINVDVKDFVMRYSPIVGDYEPSNPADVEAQRLSIAIDKNEVDFSSRYTVIGGPLCS